jgi:hypothetical protein
VHRLNPNVWNKLCSTQRSGVIVSLAEDEDDLTSTFYELHTATRRRLGVTVQPRRYYSLVWRRILEPDSTFSWSRWQMVTAGVFSLDRHRRLQVRSIRRRCPAAATGQRAAVARDQLG